MDASEPNHGAVFAPPPDAPLSRSAFMTLVLGSIGVVYGDIGTSPLYAFKEAITAAGGGHADRGAVLGVLSLILWALIIIVTVKYVLILLYADNHGEGGTLALMALAEKALGGGASKIALLGVAGAALFFGDAIITPAISVLSAMEGLKLATPLFEPYILPITLAILVGLFAIQSRGTSQVAAYFGPITAAWFVIIALAGVVQIVKRPEVLAAIYPGYAVRFLAANWAISVATLGAVFLAVTGAEALYADLGHFGRRPIQLAWVALVLPSLVLNYLGQGALVLSDPTALESPFYRLFPEALILPMVILAAIATVIASQAVITGAYSVGRQAIQLGVLPRLEVRHTSEEQSGQIYMPQVNALLLAGVVLLVLMFRSSSNLASAYGIAVTGTMVVTAIMALVVIWKGWGWPLWRAALLMVPLATIDLMFLVANFFKVFEGGWVTLTVAGGLLLVMLTWKRGVKIVSEAIRKEDIPLGDLIRQLEAKHPATVRGTAIYLTRHPEHAPAALLHGLKHFKVMHERIAVLVVHNARVPRVPVEAAVKLTQLSPHFWSIEVSCGFMETPNIPKALEACSMQGWAFDLMDTSFVLSRLSIKPDAHAGMPLWQDHLFITLTKNAEDATEYFSIPRERVVELGAQVSV
jgi:KUP system potassium uptake protein